MTSRRDRSRQAAAPRARARRVGHAAGALLAATVLAGCAVGGSTTGQGPPSSPRADLAAEAEVAARNLEQVAPGRRAERDRQDRATNPRPESDDAGAAGKGGADEGDGPAGPGPSAGAAPVGGAAGSDGGHAAGATWSPLLSVPDPAADRGGAPGYADLRELIIEDDGRHLRVTLRMSELLPGRLGVGEVEGVGVDLFRTHPQESDFQLFLDGGAHGWRGYLQTPRGFVSFPGTVTVRGAVLTTTVPWTAVGGRRDGEVSAFVDWTDGTGRAGSDQVERVGLRLP